MPDDYDGLRRLFSEGEQKKETEPEEDKAGTEEAGEDLSGDFLLGEIWGSKGKPVQKQPPPDNVPEGLHTEERTSQIEKPEPPARAEDEAPKKEQPPVSAPPELREEQEVEPEASPVAEETEEAAKEEHIPSWAQGVSDKVKQPGLPKADDKSRWSGHAKEVTGDDFREGEKPARDIYNDIFELRRSATSEETEVDNEPAGLPQAETSGAPASKPGTSGSLFKDLYGEDAPVPPSKMAKEEPPARPIRDAQPPQQVREEPPVRPIRDAQPPQQVREEPPAKPIREEQQPRPVREEPPAKPIREEQQPRPVREEPPAKPVMEDQPQGPIGEEEPIEPEPEEDTPRAKGFIRYEAAHREEFAPEGTQKAPSPENPKETQAAMNEVQQLRESLLYKPAHKEPRVKKPKKPKYTEPKVLFNPLIGLIGMLGVLCLGAALVITALGLPAGISLLGLSGFGCLLLVVYGIANGRNLRIILSARSTKYGTNITLVILSLFAIIVVVNSIGFKHYTAIDVTTEKLNSLSDQTVEVLRKLNKSGEEVKATVFVPKERDFNKFRDLIEMVLEKYEYYLPKLDIKYLDPDVSKQKAEELNFDERVGVVFQLGDKKEKAVGFSENSFWGYESTLTSALLRISGTKARRIYFLTGHYEYPSDDYDTENRQSAGLFAQDLELAGYQIEKLSFASGAKVPVDCSLLVIAGPEKPFAPEEVAAVKSYVDSGGKVILLLEARNDAGFKSMLTDFGIEYRDDLIADDTNNLHGSNNLYPVLELNEHDITAPLQRRGMDVVFFKASGMDVQEDRPTGQFITRLLSTKPGGGSWSETGESENVVKDESKPRGPFTMAVLAGEEVKESTPPAAEGETSSGEKKEAPTRGTNWGLLLVTGDASFIANSNLETLGNKDFILNAVDYMTGEDTLMTVRPRDMRPLLALTKFQATLVFLFAVVLIPMLVTIIGVTVWFKRK